MKNLKYQIQNVKWRSCRKAHFIFKTVTPFLFTILFLLSSQSFAQRITVSATVSDQDILIGEQFLLTLKASASSNQTIQWFDLKDIPHFEILNRSKLDSQVNGNTKTLEQTFRLTSWDSGRWNLPSFSLHRSNRTKPVSINVSFAPFDPKQAYHDVKDIIEVSRPGQVKWYWYIVGILFLAALFFLIFPIRKKKKEEILVEGAYKKALKQLEALKKKDIAEREFKTYYTELIDIFRGYLHIRKNIQSFSKTTEDLGAQVGKLHLPGNDYQQLLDTLQLSDFVKFARYKPTAAENQASFDVIKRSIVSIENLKTEEKKEVKSL